MVKKKKQAKRDNAKIWFGLTAGLVLVGVVIQLLVTANLDGERFASTTERLLNVFTFFTIQANLLVGITSFMLFRNPKRLSNTFWGFRLSSIVAIAITGIVYHAVLASQFDMSGWAAVANQILHTWVPIMAVLGWIVYGPRGHLNPLVIRLSLVFPVVWLLFTLIRGAIIDWYPYSFLRVSEIGYLSVGLNVIVITGLFFALAAGAHLVESSVSKVKA